MSTIKNLKELQKKIIQDFDIKDGVSVYVKYNKLDFKEMEGGTRFDVLMIIPHDVYASRTIVDITESISEFEDSYRDKKDAVFIKTQSFRYTAWNKLNGLGFFNLKNFKVNG